MAYSREQISTIKRLFPDHTYQEIAAAIGVSAVCLRAAISRMQDTGEVPLKRPRWSDGERQLVCDMLTLSIIHRLAQNTTL